ncbi:PucR family transcriptional regulator [Gordonia aurantiaca]|uniref:PucR family transcriptional regulator n=1 Tax=Gordonia sp. B21 TaxID=3151852 RepID=UPI0032677A5A
MAIGDAPSRAAHPGTPTVTVADVALATGVVVATTGVDTDATVTRFVDLRDSDDLAEWSARDEPAPGESFATTLIAVPWRPQRPDGPLPALDTLLAPVLRRKPAAVVVTPGRPVNPPTKVVELLGSQGVVLLWDRHAEASFAHVIERAGGTPRREDCSAPEAPGPATRDSGLGGLATAVLAVADDVAALEAVLTGFAGAPVRIRLSGSRGRTTEGVTVALGQGASLTVLDIDALNERQRLMVDLVRPLLALHTRARWASPVDERIDEATRVLKQILGEDLAQREQSIRRSRRLSLFPDRPVVFVAIEPFNVSVDLPGLQRLREDVALVVRRHDPQAVAVIKDGMVVTPVSIDVDLDAMLRAVCRAVHVPLAAGAGDPVTEPRGYAGSFRQAGRAVAVGRRIGAINRITRHSELGVLALLYQLPEHARRSFVADTLRSVADNTPESLEQRRILRALRATDCNISESARRLFVHPNTLRAKISRIESIIGPIVSDPERRLTVFTALSMYSLDSGIDD